jgi:hypothetical protein
VQLQKDARVRTHDGNGWLMMRVWRDYGALGAGTFALEAPEVRGCA